MTPETSYKIIHSMNGSLPGGEWCHSVAPPFLPQLISELFVQLDHPQEARGRQYQRDLVRQGYFTVTSQRTGRPTASGDSIILTDRTVFYRFPEEPNLLVAAANLSKGYPLTAVLLLSEQLLIHLGESTWGVKETHLNELTGMLGESRWWPTRPANHVHIFTGDPSYAHHAWNQLGALHTLLSERRKPGLPVTLSATFQPLGPLHELLPDHLSGPVAWENCQIAPACNSPGRVSMNAGGFCVTALTRARVHALAMKHGSEATRDLARQLKRRHDPVVWISVRTRNRTAVNQRELILALCSRLLSNYARCAIIIDGHSSPYDYPANPAYDPCDTKICLERDTAEAQVITELLMKQNPPRPKQRIVPAAGLPLADSIVLAHAADFYFCHHGTVQHKIGWLANKPGVVHSNRRTLLQRPAPWVAAQVENGCLPIYIPDDYVEDLAEEQDADQTVASRFFEHYRFMNISATADFVLTCLRAVRHPVRTRSRELARRIAAPVNRLCRILR